MGTEPRMNTNEHRFQRRTCNHFLRNLLNDVEVRGSLATIKIATGEKR